MDDHYSHNVSDCMWLCYGCGASAGDPRLKQPCPTPDLVGQSRIKYEKQKETAFYAAFEGGNDRINVYGVISTSVMQWGIERGYVQRVGTTSEYILTDAGKTAMKVSPGV